MKALCKSVLIIICLIFIIVEIYAQSTIISQTKQTERLKCDAINAALSKPWGKLFCIERINGNYCMGDTMSHFNNNKDFEHLTFDISNNKVLANMGIQGTLKNITVYRDTYFANCSPPSGLTDGSWPGVWAAKDNSSYGPYSFTLDILGQHYELDKVDWDFRTGLLDNLFPVTEFTGPEGRFTIKLIAYAPVSSDGSKRIRGLVYGLYLENNSSEQLSGTIHLPKLFGNNRQAIGTYSWALFDPYDYEMALADTDLIRYDVPFELKRGEYIWVPVVFNMLGDSALQEINKIGTPVWLDQTTQYFRNMIGKMESPDDPYLAEFYERQVMEAFGSIAMSESGKIAGSNWGSYPATRQIWMKDFYYSSLPFTMLDTGLAQKLILWFNEFGVRPRGNILKGGVNHSLGISMASIMLAGLYYEYTGDREFFLQNQQLKDSWHQVIQELIASRQDPDIWLFPSKYISDGYIQLDYHTGSNVCVWFALISYANILEGVFNDRNNAVQLKEIADRVHSAILEKCTVAGPYGRQFIEATWRDGREAPMESDGEESDITLMPFYGFLPWDNPTYLNYMKFSMSEHNRLYQPDLHAITWFGVQSTAPGYLKGICAGTDMESLFGIHGYLTEIRKVTDADGSVWWWNYGWPSESIPDYGQVVRGVPGKSGWFSGIYASIFISRQLGLTFQAKSSSLKFTPFMLPGGISWNNFNLAGKRYSIDYHFDQNNVEVNLININPERLRMEFSLPLRPDQKGFQTYVNGNLFTDIQLNRYLNQDNISFLLDIPEKGNINVQLLPRGVRPE